MNRHSSIVVALFASAALVLTACSGGSDPDPTSVVPAAPTSSETITIGSANFSENVLLAEIYAGALEAQGVTVERELNLGPREELIPAMKEGKIDLTPEYSGNLLAYFNPKVSPVEPTEVYRALAKATPKGLEVLEQADAQDKDAVVVTEKTAEKYDLFSISDLKAHAAEMTLGGPPEWKTRQTGVVGLKDLYGLEFKNFKALDAGGPLTIAALKDGEVDAADVFTTDPNIATEGWVVLPDPRNLFPAQNVLPLIRSDKASDTVQNALYNVSSELSTDSLARMMVDVVVNKKDPAAVAKNFLEAHNLA